MRLLALGILLLLLAGCGDDKPVYDQPNSSSANASQPAAAPALPSAPADNDPPDPLLSGSDPLTKGADSVAPPSSGDPMQGPQMPTQHSHWLNAEMSQARISVLLNGLRLSSSLPPGTQDVTMKLRPGPNTLTVIYEPRNQHSWGSVTLAEGEHNDAKAISLAEFRQAPLADSSPAADEGQAALKPITRTFTFIAN